MRFALPAYEIERTVGEMPAGRDLVTGLADDKAREIARRSQVCRQMLGFQTRLRMLRRLVEEVFFFESDSMLTLRFDTDASCASGREWPGLRLVMRASLPCASGYSVRLDPARPAFS